MDDSTFRQLKESNYYHPEVTDVILDSSIMMQMALHSFRIAEQGYNTIWDSEMLDYATDHFKDGLDLLEERIREKGIRFHIITEISKDNIDKTESLSGAIIRHLDNLSGNFGIFDNRAYMVHLTPKKGEPPDQTL